jgi:hypothetical protein
MKRTTKTKSGKARGASPKPQWKQPSGKPEATTSDFVEVPIHVVEEWFTTPKPPDYTLCMWDINEGETVEWISMSRQEYISLKRELARMRGLSTQPELFEDEDEADVSAHDAA